MYKIAISDKNIGVVGKGTTLTKARENLTKVLLVGGWQETIEVQIHQTTDSKHPPRIDWRLIHSTLATDPADALTEIDAMIKHLANSNKTTA